LLDQAQKSLYGLLWKIQKYSNRSSTETFWFSCNTYFTLFCRGMGFWK
jgi:hypothetical protein